MTYLAADYPVFWERASGALVTDVDGNRYLDLTSAFGVAATGHTNPHVASAVAEQAQRLLHGMGDVHPTELRTRLLARLAQLAPGDLRKSYLATSGAEAVEFALKTALLATGKPRVLAYHGAYHGLSLGALEVAGIDKFRAPFAPLVPARDVPAVSRRRRDRRRRDRRRAHGARARSGHRRGDPRTGAGPRRRDRAAAGFLRALRALCDERGLLLILDEIYTGFGRTGTMFACEREGVVPDLLCVGKALGGGVPLVGDDRDARA